MGGAAALTVTSIASCRSPGDEEDGMTAPEGPLGHVSFPEPTESAVPLEVALRQRRSEREFAAEPLTDGEVGQLLWAAQGITADWGGRTAPSAGGTYPLELHALTSRQALHYLPEGHRAEIVATGDLRPRLMAAALDQEAVGAAPLVIAVVAVPDRTAAQYGNRAGRYVDLEVGHAAQNVLLQAVALGLVAVPVGSFDDDAVADALGLPAGHEARYLLPFGRPRER
jgi:SagB-type dehydrogenase family enzyme